MTTIFDGIWHGALLAACMWLLLKVIPRLNAATRYAAWWITVIAAVILILGPIAIRSKSQPTTGPLAAVVAGSSRFLHSVSLPSKMVTMVAEQTSPMPSPMDTKRWFPIHVAAKSVAVSIGCMWAIASIVLLVRLALSWRWLQRVKRHASAAPGELQERLNHLALMARTRRMARLLVSDDVAAPMALGLFEAAILIPRSLPEQMSGVNFDHIALHELAHLRRYDDWMNLAQKLLEALLPIQPALFWIGRQLTLEREIACDDWVVAVSGAPKRYAASLARVAELTLWARCGVLASGVAGTRSQLYRRVQCLLDKSRNMATRVATMPLALAGILAVALVLTPIPIPQLIALADPAPVAANAPEDVPAAPPEEPGTHTQSFSVNAADKLTMKVDEGNIAISTWAQNVVRVTVIQKGPGLDEYLKHHEVLMTQGVNQVWVHATSHGWSSPDGSEIHVEYKVVVPRNFDANLDDGAGNVDVADLHGAVQVQTGAGNLDFHKTYGSVVAHSGAGNIAASECAGNLSLHTGAGNLVLSKMSAAVDGHTGAGNIDLNEFAGSSMKAESGTGTVSAELVAQPKADCTLRSGTGNIVLKLRQNFGLNMNVSTSMGNIDSDIPAALERNFVGGAIHGPINGGGPLMSLETGMGNIQISKP